MVPSSIAAAAVGVLCQSSREVIGIAGVEQEAAALYLIRIEQTAQGVIGMGVDSAKGLGHIFK